MKALLSAEAALLVLIAALHFVVCYDGISQMEEWSYYLGTRSLVEGRELDLGDDFQQTGLSEVITQRKILKERMTKIPGEVFTPQGEEGEGQVRAKEFFDVSATLPIDPKARPSAMAAKAVEETKTAQEESKAKPKIKAKAAKKSPEAKPPKEAPPIPAAVKIGRGTHVAPGSFFLDAPFYLLGKKISKSVLFQIATKNRVFNSIAAEETVRINTVLFGHMVFSILAVLIFYATFVTLGYEKCHSIAAAALMLFGTPLARYGFTGFNQAASALALAVLIYVTARLAQLDTTDETGRHLGMIILAGLVTGAATTVNYLNVFALVGLLVYVLLMKSSWLEALLRAALLVVAFAAVAWVIPVWFKANYGQYTHPYMGRMFDVWGMIKSIPFRKVLLLERNGLLVFAPILVVGFAGAAQLSAARKESAAAWHTMLFGLITFGLIALATDSYVDWAGGKFSSRLMTGASLLLGLGVVHLLSQSYNRWAAYVVSFAAAVYSMVLLFIFRLELFPGWRKEHPSIVDYKCFFTREYSWLRKNLTGQLFEHTYIVRDLIRTQRLDILFGVWTIFLILTFITVRRLERRTLQQELIEKRRMVAEKLGPGYKRRGV